MALIHAGGSRADVYIVEERSWIFEREVFRPSEEEMLSPTEKNRPNLANRRLNVPAVYIMPQL